MHLQYVEQQGFIGNLKGKFWVSDRLSDGPSQLSVMLRPAAAGGAGGPGCNAACKKTLPRKLSYWITTLVGNGKVRDLYVKQVLKRTCQLPASCDLRGTIPTDSRIAAIEVIRQQLAVTSDLLPQFEVVDMLGVTASFSLFMVPVLIYNAKILWDQKQRKKEKEEERLGNSARVLQRAWRRSHARRSKRSTST